MFGRSPNITNGDFLVPISSKCNVKSNAHVHYAQNSKESAQNGDLIRYGEIRTLQRVTS